MAPIEQKLRELDELTKTPEFLGLSLEERRNILEEFYGQELAHEGIEKESFLESFRDLLKEASPAPASQSRLTQSVRKQVNLKPLWWTLGGLGITAAAITGTVVWLNSSQDISKLDDTTLVKGLPGGEPIRQAEVALRRSLPDTGVDSWEVEKTLEQILEPIKERNWIAGREQVAKTLEILARNEPNMMAKVPASLKPQAAKRMDDLRRNIRILQDKIYRQDVTDSTLQYHRVLWYFDLFQLAMLGDYKTDVPPQYRNRPYLDGGWTMVKFTTNRGSFVALVDGFNAPLTGGNFLDLVNRGFYDGLKISRAERLFLVQTGAPGEEPNGGFKDPATGKIRNVPLEVRPARKESDYNFSRIIQRRVDYTEDRFGIDPLKLREEMAKIHNKYIKGGENPIVYGQTTDKFPAIPYGPPGTFSMARLEKDPNSASSQFFISFSDPELTPTGNNLFDGKYANFAYITQGIKNVRKLRVGDVIQKAKVLNCKEPGKETEFEELRETEYTGTALDTSKVAASTLLETSCLPLPSPKLINGTN
jgi:peptidylprolyl isomerase